MARVTWDGMQELEDGLDQLAANMAAEGGALAVSYGNDAAAAIRAAYPRRSGHLADSVTVQQKTLRAGMRVKVRNTAAYAYAFESGRMLGKHGTTPARPTFIPIRERMQRDLQLALIHMVEQAGLKVFGNG